MAGIVSVRFQMAGRDDEIGRRAPTFVSARDSRADFTQRGTVVAGTLGQRERTVSERIREQESVQSLEQGGKGGSTGGFGMNEPESNYAPDHDRDGKAPSNTPDSGTGGGGGGYNQGGWWAT